MLANKRILVCSKNRLTLTAVTLAEPILQSLVGGTTTEDEALQIQLESNPDLLITSEDLERGYGIRLVEKAKRKSPDLKALIFLSRESPEVVQEAMEAGADGVMFVSSIGTGDGDFINALRTTNKKTGLASWLKEDVLYDLESDIKYEGYINRHQKEINRLLKHENQKIPKNLVFSSVPGLSKEALEKLNLIKPENLGQASRVSGVTPADMSSLLIFLSR